VRTHSWGFSCRKPREGVFISAAVAGKGDQNSREYVGDENADRGPEKESRTHIREVESGRRERLISYGQRNPFIVEEKALLKREYIQRSLQK